MYQQSMYQACINLIPDVPRQEMRDGQIVDTQPILLRFIKLLIGNLVVVPGHPDKGNRSLDECVFVFIIGEYESF